MWYWILRAGVIAILKLFFKFKVEGIENLPQKSNFIVAANHASFLDPWVIGAAIPRRIYWIALRGFFNNLWLNWFMRTLRALPKGGSSQKAIRLLTSNKNIGLFPEGTRTHDGKLKEFKRGAALFSFKTGRPIVPCAIIGTCEAYPRGAKFPRFLPVKVRIGKPIYLLKEFEEIVDDILLQEGTFKLKNAIKEMLNAG